MIKTWKDSNILKNLKERRQSDDGPSVSIDDLMGFYEELKESIGTDDLCDELSFYIVENMGNKGLKKALDHISEMYL